MNILLAVDGSAYTKKMLAYLATHDELLGGNHQYTVLTVQAPLPARARAALGKEVVDAYHAEEAEKILAPVCKFLARHGVDAKRSVKVVRPAGDGLAWPWRPGHPGDGVSDHASAGAQQGAAADRPLTRWPPKKALHCRAFFRPNETAQLQHNHMVYYTTNWL
jgi:hypothetical protein